MNQNGNNNNGPDADAPDAMVEEEADPLLDSEDTRPSGWRPTPTNQNEPPPRTNFCNALSDRTSQLNISQPQRNQRFPPQEMPSSHQSLPQFSFTTTSDQRTSINIHMTNNLQVSSFRLF